LSDRSSVTRTGPLPSADTTQMLLAAMFPRGRGCDEADVAHDVGDAATVRRPRREWSSLPVATTRGPPPSSGLTYSESPDTNKNDRPAGRVAFFPEGRGLQLQRRRFRAGAKGGATEGRQVSAIGGHGGCRRYASYASPQPTSTPPPHFPAGHVEGPFRERRSRVALRAHAVAGTPAVRQLPRVAGRGTIAHTPGARAVI